MYSSHEDSAVQSLARWCFFDKDSKFNYECRPWNYCYSDWLKATHPEDYDTDYRKEKRLFVFGPLFENAEKSEYIKRRCRKCGKFRCRCRKCIPSFDSDTESEYEHEDEHEDNARRIPRSFVAMKKAREPVSRLRRSGVR